VDLDLELAGMSTAKSMVTVPSALTFSSMS
jgi:hypothetical protein